MTTATDFGQNAPNRRIVTVLGGTGFLGHRVVRHLLKHGFSVRIISRHPEQALSLLKPDQTGVEVVRADVHDETSVAEALAGAFGAVNAVSLYVERGDRETFHAVHVDAAARIARLAREAGVRRLVHVSGIGADLRPPRRITFAPVAKARSSSAMPFPAQSSSGPRSCSDRMTTS